MKTFFQKKDLPAINMRVRQLIEYYAGGSVKLFSEKVKLASSQKLNRIFNVDKRNGEYPDVSSDILIAIANMYSEVDINWLLTGQGNMFRDVVNLPSFNVSANETTLQLVNTISSQAETIGYLRKEVEMLKTKLGEEKPEEHPKGLGQKTAKDVSTKPYSSQSFPDAPSANALLNE